MLKLKMALACLLWVLPERSTSARWIGGGGGKNGEQGGQGYGVAAARGATGSARTRHG